MLYLTVKLTYINKRFRFFRKIMKDLFGESPLTPLIEGGNKIEIQVPLTKGDLGGFFFEEVPILRKNQDFSRRNTVDGIL